MTSEEVNAIIDERVAFNDFIACQARFVDAVEQAEHCDEIASEKGDRWLKAKEKLKALGLTQSAAASPSPPQ